MFKIKVYLHDRIDNDILYGLLRKNKFEVIRARESKIAGLDDELHIQYAKINNAFLVTERRDLYIPRGMNHKGIFIVYEYNDPNKDMTPDKIIKALKNIRKQIEKLNVSFNNLVLPLNGFL